MKAKAIRFVLIGTLFSLSAFGFLRWYGRAEDIYLEADGVVGFIKLGDTRKSVEARFGKPVYYFTDSDMKIPVYKPLFAAVQYGYADEVKVIEFFPHTTRYQEARRFVFHSHPTGSEREVTFNEWTSSEALYQSFGCDMVPKLSSSAGRSIQSEVDDEKCLVSGVIGGGLLVPRGTHVGIQVEGDGVYIVSIAGYYDGNYPAMRE